MVVADRQSAQVSGDLVSRGLEVRREVLGDEYVNAAMAGADEFGRPLQELISGYCWGAVWDRDGLTRPQRSMLNIGMLIALNRPHELKIHFEGALNNGVTINEIREAILQSAIYCGVPAALDAMRIARAVMKARGLLP
jgi:4-carboxymuconolactone decarboxylase